LVQAVIVAAGVGSRLYPFTQVLPKIMLPVGKTQKPMGEWIIEHCKRHGIMDFVFCLNDTSGQQVENYFNSGERFGVKIQYSYSSEPQGTSGEIKLAFKAELINCPAIIYYGDMITKADLTKLMNTEADVRVVVNESVTVPFGIIQYYENDKAEYIMEKPKLSEIEGNGGAIMPIYYVNNHDFFWRSEKGKDVSGTLLPEMLEAGYDIEVYQDDTDFIDIGSWNNYLKAREWEP